MINVILEGVYRFKGKEMSGNCLLFFLTLVWSMENVTEWSINEMD